MGAKDLMIGDWVYAIDENGDKHIGRVNNLEYDYVNKKDSFCVDFFGTGFEPEFPDVLFHIQPIPLTPEILEKNGFENDFYEDESVADYVKVRIEGYSLHCTAHEWDAALVTCCNGHVDVVTDFSGEFRGEIEYVHQLQHALRLCGIDKEIVVC